MRDHDAASAHVIARDDVPFGWDGTDPGVQDCLRFVMDGVLAQTGVDPIADLRGQWSDEASANVILSREGGLAKLVARRLTGTRPAFAQRGDVALVVHDGRLALGLVEGEFVVCLAGPEGVSGYARHPRAAMRRAWRANPVARSGAA